MLSILLYGIQYSTYIDICALEAVQSKYLINFKTKTMPLLALPTKPKAYSITKDELRFSK